MDKLAPIVLFCYNRPQHTKQTLTALSENILAEQSELFVFCDGPKADATEEQLKKIEEVRRIVKIKKWCGNVTVFESLSNKGLANSVIDGVTKIVKEYERVIVLEDDLITSKFFLEYMNTALEKYKGEERVMQISGFMFPLKQHLPEAKSFFLPFSTSWGWATWSRAWNKFDPQALGYKKLSEDDVLRCKFNLDSTYPFTEMLINQMSESRTVDSWAIKWWWKIFSTNGISLFPSETLVYNNGFGSDATHTKTNEIQVVNFNDSSSISYFPEEIEIDNAKWDLIKSYYKETFSKPNNIV
ncbi:MAG: glycosyltransferase, partial [Bacteroidetes bacterium]|nr:glycosyltransferase [Bacteroidota bacterium]